MNIVLNVGKNILEKVILSTQKFEFYFIVLHKITFRLTGL